MKFIPNLFTLLNLLCGCLAIVFLLTDGLVFLPAGYSPAGMDYQGEGTIIDLPASIVLSSIFIGVAAVLDLMDGLIARVLKAESAIGIQLDSLADLVSFGVAPGMILFSFLHRSYAAGLTSLDTSIWYVLPAFFVPLAAAWRLARFNITPSGRGYFEGVPTPAVGLVIACFPLSYWLEDGSRMSYLLQQPWFIYLLSIVFSLLMVVRMPHMNFKMKGFGWAGNEPRYLFLITAIGLGVWMRWSAAFPVFAAYVVLSLLFQKKLR